LAASENKRSLANCFHNIRQPLLVCRGAFEKLAKERPRAERNGCINLRRRIMKYQTLLIAAVVLGLGTLAQAQNAKPTIKSEALKDTAADSGSEMFRTYCAVCHGPNGRGDGPAASALKKQPADLTQLTTKNAGKFPALRIAGYIEGNQVVAAHGTRDMPIWGKLFRSLGPTDSSDATTKLRIHNITNYVETLQAKD
jgi:mono/diheme cytochrome c family protein